jgi:hypothetical protein
LLMCRNVALGVPVCIARFRSSRIQVRYSSAPKNVVIHEAAPCFAATRSKDALDLARVAHARRCTPMADPNRPRPPPAQPAVHHSP